MKNAAFETFKFVARTVILVGVPAVVAALVKARPSYGVPVGFVLVTIDKYIHKLPNEYNGILNF